MNLTEQIKAYRAKKQAAQNAAKDLVELTVKEGRTFDQTERDQHADYLAEIKSIDEHLAILENHQAMMLKEESTTLPNDAGRDTTQGSGGAGVTKGNGSTGHVSVKVNSNLPPDMAFTRFMLCMAHAKGNVMLAHEIAKERYPETPQVQNVLRKAIGMGGTKDLSDLVRKAAVTSVAGTDTAVTQYTDMESAFVDLLRPKSIMGRMSMLDRVPFLMRAGRQLTGASGSFVGEGAPKPVNKQTYDNVTLGYAKVAVIVVLTEEAVRFSSIRAEERARDDIVKGVATYIDKRFMDPSYSGVANVSPASITNAATRVQSSGVTLAAIDADVRNAMAPFTNSDIDPSTAVWVMSAAVALRLALRRNSYDEPAFPEMKNAVATGAGVWYGLPVIVSNSMVTAGSSPENQIALVTQSEVFLADDGGFTIDMSEQASVQMNDAPSAGAASLLSLWQNNLIGIRAERFINWAPKRTSNLGIVLIENVAY